jgi:manganese/iron transport system substrate-binding protein
MSPSNAITYVENLRKAFINIDPINEALYTSNATRYSNEIREVDRQLRAKLKKLPADKRWLVTSEGAFSYLARDYDMKELFLWPVNADQEGTPQQVKHVVDTVVANKIPVIFSESTISDKSMKQVAKEAGTRFGGVLYVDSLTDADGVAPTYLKLLDYNAKVITTAFDQKQ